jgi:hypothetical protein
LRSKKIHANKFNVCVLFNSLELYSATT